MANIIGRNLFRAIILILVAGLVIGILYVLSFTSLDAAPNQGEFPGGGQGEGQFQTPPEGAEFEPLPEGGQEFGQGQGNGFGGGRHQGQGQGLGLGQGRGGGGEAEFSLERGVPEFMAHLVAVTIIIAIVYFLQYLAKRRQRVSPAA